MSERTVFDVDEVLAAKDRREDQLRRLYRTIPELRERRTSFEWLVHREKKEMRSGWEASLQGKASKQDATHPSGTRSGSSARLGWRSPSTLQRPKTSSASSSACDFARALTRSTGPTDLHLARSRQSPLRQLLDAEVGRRDQKGHRGRVILGARHPNQVQASQTGVKGRAVQLGRGPALILNRWFHLCEKCLHKSLAGWPTICIAISCQGIRGTLARS